jgi:hypothetical protein
MRGTIPAPGSDAAVPLASSPRIVSVITAKSTQVAEASPRSERSADRMARSTRAERLAAQLDGMVDDAERTLRASVSARDAQQIAWLVVCDRGWPRAVLRTDIDLALTDAWMLAWGAHVALPIRLMTPRDLVEQRRIRRRLEQCESALRSALPPAVWHVVDPLDETGRSTLAYVLQAIVVWVDACARCDECARVRERFAIRFSMFAEQAHALGLVPPLALLDLDGWRTVIAAARVYAAGTRDALTA